MVEIVELLDVSNSKTVFTYVYKIAMNNVLLSNNLIWKSCIKKLNLCFVCINEVVRIEKFNGGNFFYFREK